MAGAGILVIDADPRFREGVRRLLTADGFEVATAATSDEGLRRFEQGTGWDLVLLDHRPGTLDGEVVAGCLHRRALAVPILMLTAHGSLELQKRVLGNGVMGMLLKPVSPDELRRAVRRILRNWESSPSSTATVAARPTVSGDGFRPLPPEVLLGVAGLPPRRPEPPHGDEAPHVSFRTVNGYRFWPVPIPEEDQETAARWVLRVFDVRSPLGVTRRCAVELPISVRRLVKEATGQDFPAYDRIWDTVCKSALSTHLWARAEAPSENLLVHGLDEEQLRIIRAMAGSASD